MANRIEAEEIALRHTTKEDINEFINLVANPSYSKLSPFGSLSEEDAHVVLDRIIARYSAEDQKNVNEFWVVENKHNNEYIGFVGFEPVIFEDTLEEMVFVKFKKKFLDTSLPLMAVKALCSYAFSSNDISRLIAFINPKSSKDIDVAKSLGCTFEKECSFFDATSLLFSLNKG